jgi:predicted ATPase
MSRAEKAALEQRARAAGRLSTSEYIRRAVSATDNAGTAEEAAELAALLPVFRASHAETLRRVDDTIRRLDDTLAFLQAARFA